MTLEQSWPRIRQLFREAIKTSFHHAIASVDAKGNPHVTPIGSLYLDKNLKGTYAELFTSKMPKNLAANQRVCVMAVPSRIRTWLSALWRGRFPKPPGVRLYGTVGERRQATEAERARLVRAFRPFRFFKGHDLMWSKVEYVRDIHFDDWAPINIGPITRGVWKES